MKKVLPLVLVALVLASCLHRSRVIPAAKLSDIYVDMFMADQWVAQNQRARKTADTSNLYAPILEKYGYTVEDYDASVKHYLRKPDKYAKILKSAGAKLNRQAKRLEAIEDAIQKRVKFSPYKPEKFRYDTLRFKDDSLGLWPNDSSFVDRGALRDSLSRLDSLALADSLALRDSLARRDSIARRDSLARVDSIARLAVPKKEVITNNDKTYGSKERSEKVLLLHGPDNAQDRGHSKLREVPGGQGKQTR